MSTPVTAGAQSGTAVTGASPPVFSGLAGLPEATKDSLLEPPSCRTVSEVTDPTDNLGMPPEIDVDLMMELMEETDVLPTSRDQESDTDPLLLPPALASVEVDMATREISQLLLEILSGQPLAPEATASGPTPEPSISLVEEAPMGWWCRCMRHPHHSHSSRSIDGLSTWSDVDFGSMPLQSPTCNPL